MINICRFYNNWIFKDNLRASDIIILENWRTFDMKLSRYATVQGAIEKCISQCMPKTLLRSNTGVVDPFSRLVQVQRWHMRGWHYRAGNTFTMFYWHKLFSLVAAKLTSLAKKNVLSSFQNPPWSGTCGSAIYSTSALNFWMCLQPLLYSQYVL